MRTYQIELVNHDMRVLHALSNSDCADRYEVSDCGTLHFFAADREVATLAPGTWILVMEVQPTPTASA